MNEVFNLFLREFGLAFYDDILVYSRSLPDHVEHLRTVLGLLAKHHLYAKKFKSMFACDDEECLGYLISREGVKTDPRKTAAMQQWPVPDDVKALRGFLGLIGYYRKFIKGYGQIAAPLTTLLKTNFFV